MVAAAVERFGALHFAFNNAGVAQLNRVPLHETDEATWSGIMNVNLKGIWLCMKYEVPELLKSGQGAAIVNTSSGSSPLGYPNIGSYVASKAGVDALTRVAAIELAGKGIRVNGINPGYIGTPMLTAVMNPDDLKRLAQNTPLQKLTTAEDISRTAVWLLSSSIACLPRITRSGFSASITALNSFATARGCNSASVKNSSLVMPMPCSPEITPSKERANAMMRLTAWWAACSIA